ncbi:MAG: hypothetical protein GTO67_12390 [Gammaproteobacteria bacterium]|nr:hypothetical protein [Gammaproteobacteria bacterium]NIM73807.1 hypothetical protein [Gammaproteobacteria bacterium]NIN39384.1 hypothetical protein [Gammaproteobacteria bacterium]NIO25049.1 hypothetical protein [Gammaproteobacteria bacterium]NIO65681.1 hypothetical protein [Gammaproteobacteria bacterium]
MAFDENIAPDVDSVLTATALLDITEWDFFNLAYNRWHGEPAAEGIMEPIFAAYMFDDIVPPWARHFSRLVERLYRRGVLDRAALGVERLPSSAQMVGRGMRYSVLIAAILTALIVVAEFLAQIVKIGERCFFPPCY